MNINEKIRHFLDTLEKMIHILQEKQITALEDYKKNVELQLVVERALHQSIQSCIDIGARIIATKKFRGADDYCDIFEVLKNEDVIDNELCKKMIDLARFRNILVHEYFRIDPEKVYLHLQENLNVLKEFLITIVKYLDGEE